MKKHIAVLPGDGIGPEVTAQAVKVLKSVARRFGYEFTFTEALFGGSAIESTGNPLPPETLDLCQEADAVLLGAIGDPRYDNDPKARVRPEQGLLGLRKALGLYANVRPIQVYPSLIPASPLREERLRDVDFVVYRELTGGIYFGDKGRSEEGNEAFDTCTYRREEIERIAKVAFEAARHRRKHLTLVDKANVLETSRFWREVVMEIAKDYPEVRTDYLFVDNAAMQLILQPSQFDVILTENMFGDILTDEASVITGSIGMLPSASLGGRSALFEPVHGSYPQAAGQDIANPMAAILSAAMMLEHFGANKAAAEVRAAVAYHLEAVICTVDIRPDRPFGTQYVGDEIAEYITEAEEGVGSWINFENVRLGQSTII